MSEFREAPLSELVVSLDHLRRPVRSQDRKPGPFPYYGASGVVDSVSDYLFEGLHLLIAEDGENLRTRKTPIAFLADGKFWVNNHAHVVQGNQGSDTRYLAYAVEASDVSGFLTGSTQPKLTKDSLMKLRVPAPGIRDQSAIAGVLGALDDKIESNRRICRHLDLLADALYLGSSPHHFVAASEVLKPILGGTPKRDVPEYWSGGIPWLSAKDVSSSSSGFVLETMEQISAAGVASSAAKVMESGTVIITARGTVGALARLARPMAFNQSCYGLQPLGDYRHSVIYRALKVAVAELKQMVHGTVFDTITMGTFESLNLRMPVPAELQNIQVELEQLDSLTLVRARESLHLGEIRDAILPELLSGRLRVRDAEKVVEEVV